MRIMSGSGSYFVFLIILWGLLSVYLTQKGEKEAHKLAQFEDWIRTTGAWVHSNVTLSTFPQGNGLKAASDLRENTKILTIPVDLQISRDSMIDSLRVRVKNSPVNTDTFWEIISGLEDTEIISVGLVIEECFGGKSKFYPFLAILPPQTPQLLFTWNQKELEYLQDNQLTGIAKDTARRLEYVWTEILRSNVLQNIVTNRSCLSLQSFRRYYAITLSHAMRLPDNIPRIVPMAEQINHAPSSQFDSTFSTFHVRNEKDGSISVYTDRSVKAGEQIFEEYDRLDNSLHLLQFGFVSQDNPYHCVVLRLVSPTPNWDGTACVRQDRTYVPDNEVDLLVAKYTDNIQCLKSLRSFDDEGIHETCSSSAFPQTDHNADLDHKWVRNAARRDPRSDPSLLKEMERQLEDIMGGSTMSDRELDPERLALAIQFRIEDAKLVIQLASMEASEPDETNDKEEL